MQKIRYGTKTDNTYMAKIFERTIKKKKRAYGNTLFVPHSTRYNVYDSVHLISVFPGTFSLTFGIPKL